MGVFCGKQIQKKTVCFGKHATICWLRRRCRLRPFAREYACPPSNVIATHYLSCILQFLLFIILFFSWFSYIFFFEYFSVSIEKFACRFAVRVRVRTHAACVYFCVWVCLVCSVCMSGGCMGYETRTSKQSFAYDGSEQTDDMRRRRVVCNELCYSMGLHWEQFVVDLALRFRAN